MLNLLRVGRLPIFNQLLLEEALLRNTRENWCLINDGAFCPAIVMGISGKPNELINVQEAQAAKIQAIKRFTGGGTVVVDHNTIFATLIFQGESLPDVKPFPQSIMQWTERFYQNVFQNYGAFKLRENDYVFEERKFGGNAQAITGKRWLHHTSFLWDYDLLHMALLKHPPKAPQYRQNREHEEFIVRLCDFVPSRSDLVDALVEASCGLQMQVQERTIEEASAALLTNKLFGTKLVDLRAYQ